MKTVITGLLVGLANIIPGLSGGTVLVLSGLYEKLLSAIKSPFKHITFLLQMVVGVVIGIISFAFVIRFLFDIAEVPLLFFFMGLVMGGALLFYQKEVVLAKETFHPVIVLVSFMAVLALDFLPVSMLEPSTVTLLLAGALAGATMILPGLSGALLLLLLGQYELALEYVTTLAGLDVSVLPVVAGLAISGVTGVIGMSWLMQYLLTRQRNLILNIILGLLLGSVYQITPTSIIDWTWLSALVLVPTGFYLGFLLPQLKTRT